MAHTAPNLEGAGVRKAGLDMLLAGLVVAGGLLLAWAAQQGGAFTLSQDDAYVHLAVARSLLLDGTWGATASDPGVVSSSPAWVLLLLTATSPQGAVLLASVSAGLVVLAAGAWLRDLRRLPQRALALLLVALAGRVIPLAATGLEHGLHAAAAVGLGAALHRRAVMPTLLLAMVLPALRLESVILVAVLCVGALVARELRLAEALAGGLLLGLGMLAFGFGLAGLPWWSTAVPDPSLPATAAALGWPGALATRLQENLAQAPVLALLSLSAVAWGLRSPRTSWLTWGCGLTGLAWLVVGRSGNFFRYEAWLLALLTVALLAQAARPGPDGPHPERAPAPRNTRLLAGGLALLTAAVGLPAFGLAWHGVAWQRASLGTVASMLARADLPQPVIVRNGGQARWVADPRLLDLSCRTSPSLLADCRHGGVGPERIAEVQPPPQVAVLPIGTADAVAHWPELATWTTESGPWRVAFTVRALPTATGPARAWLRGTADDLGLDLAWNDARLAPWRFDPATGEQTGDILALFAQSEARSEVEAEGPVTLAVRGTPAAGSGPHLLVFVDEALVFESELPEAPRLLPLGHLRAGTVLRVQFPDDLVDAAGNDRNVWIERVAEEGWTGG